MSHRRKEACPRERAHPPTDPDPARSGPLARYLAHPGAETARLLHHLGALAAHLGVTAGPAVVAGMCSSWP